MRKILFALDNNHISESALEFVRKMNDQEPVLVTGMYIPAFMDNLQWATPAGDAAFYVPRLLDEDEEMVRGNIIAFKEACTAYQISHRVHSDAWKSVPEGIRKETRFADLFVIGPDSYYGDGAGTFASEELRQIIEISECPVLLVPKASAFPENTVIAYDGSEDSVHALKMFSYLFPSMTKQPAVIAYASGNDVQMPDEDYVRELATRHFSNIEFSVLEFNPRKYFVTWIEERPKSMLVAGAYGRSELSLLFKKSFIENLLREHPLPVFIAHK